MIVVADASVLVGELLRRRGRELLLDSDMRLLVAEHQWEEAEHELSRRLGILKSHGRLTAEQRAALQQSIGDLIKTRAIEAYPRDTYLFLEQVAGATMRSGTERGQRRYSERHGDHLERIAYGPR